jgi:hypothetical protein
MSECFHVRLISDQTPQLPGAESFIGGKPRLPLGQGIPVCKLCGKEQTFFFQVAFPAHHAWAGHSLAVFACTECAHENALIPEMLAGPLRGKDIPEGFLDVYQANFRFIVFQTISGALRDTYNERIKFKRIDLIRTDDPNIQGAKLGGNPTWLLEDETPLSYAGNIPMFFLLQVPQGFQFETVEEAPPQVELGLDGAPQLSPLGYYQLFIGNAAFLFGTKDQHRHLVYAITQT